MTRIATGSTFVLRRLLTLARDLLQAPDRAAVLVLAGEAIPELLTAEGALLLVQLGEQEFRLEFDRHGSALPSGEDSGLLTHARRALAEQAPVVLPAVSGAGFAHCETTSLVAYPFPPHQPLGVLVACWSRPIAPAQLTGQLWTFRLLGELTGAALGNAGLRQSLLSEVAAQSRTIEEAVSQHAGELARRDDIEEEIRVLSETDVLTGLLNRRGFFLRAEQSLKVARRLALPSALLFFDIDGLKQVNDRFGHDAGDQLIADVARILRLSFRDSDVVARLGGDEFAAFTLDDSEPQAIVARVQGNIDRHSALSVTPGRVAFSTGIVQCDPRSAQGLTDYLSQADGQMYEEKRRRQAEIPPSPG